MSSLDTFTCLLSIFLCCFLVKLQMLSSGKKYLKIRISGPVLCCVLTVLCCSSRQTMAVLMPKHKNRLVQTSLLNAKQDRKGYDRWKVLMWNYQLKILKVPETLCKQGVLARHEKKNYPGHVVTWVQSRQRLWELTQHLMGLSVYYVLIFPKKVPHIWKCVY